MINELPLAKASGILSHDSKVCGDTVALEDAIAFHINKEWHDLCPECVGIISEHGVQKARADERAKIVEMLENLDKGDAVYIDDKTYYPYIRVNWSVIIQKIKEMP